MMELGVPYVGQKYTSVHKDERHCSGKAWHASLPRANLDRIERNKKMTKTKHSIEGFD